MPALSPTALTDLLHAVRTRYRLVHIDETQSVLLLYVERLLRAAECDVLRLRHLSSMAELVVAARPSRDGGPPELIVAMGYAGAGSQRRLMEIGSDLGASTLWQLGWDGVPPAEPGEGEVELLFVGQEHPRILRRSLRETVYREGQEALLRALRLLRNEWEAEPESGCYIEPLLRGNDPDPRPLPAEQVLSAWLTTHAAPRQGRGGGSPVPGTGEGGPAQRPGPGTGASQHDHPVFLLVGAPGSGKSTLLRHFAVSLGAAHLAEVQKGAHLPVARAPILVTLPTSGRGILGPGGPGGVGDPALDLDKILDHAVPGMSGKMARLLLELGLCVLLIDGPLPTEAMARLQQQPTLVAGHPPKTVLCVGARYFVQGRGGTRATHHIEEAVRGGWDLGYLDPLDDERMQKYLLLRLPDPVARSAAMAQLARSDNLRRLCRRPGLLAALTRTDQSPPLLGAGVAQGVPSPPLSELHRVLRPNWLEGVAGDRRIERIAREAVARVLARWLLRGHGDAVPWWGLVPEVGAEIPGEPDGARLLTHLVRALDDTMFIVEYEPDHYHADAVPRLRFALSSAADYFTGEDVALHLLTLPTAQVSACLQRGHGGPVRAVALSSDGRLCLTGAEDGLVRLWESGSGFLLRVFSGPGPADPVTALLFCQEDRLLASASLDMTIRLWQTDTGALVRSLVGHTDGVTTLSYAPGRDLLASGSHDGTVRIWQVGTGRCLHTLRPAGEGLSAVALGPDGLLCAAGSRDGLVHIYHAPSGELLSMVGGHCGAVRSVALSPDGRLCASGSEDQTIRLTEVRSGRLVQSLIGHEQAVTSLAFSPDGRLLASGGVDQGVRVFGLPGPGEHTPCRLLNAGKEHRGPVHSLAFVPSSSSAAGTSGTATSGKAGPHLDAERAGARGARLLASAGHDGQVLLWDATEGQVLRSLDGTAAGSVQEAALRVRCLAVSPDGELVGAGGTDGGVRLWSLRQGRLVRELRGASASSGGGVLAVVFSPDGQVLATGSEDQMVYLWDRQSGEEIDTFEGHFSDVTTLSFSPDGYLLASGSDDQTVRVREVRGGLTVRSFSHTAPVTQVCFTPDGRHIASAGADGVIRVWEVAGGPAVQRLAKHLSRVTALCISADGRLIASGGEDHLVRIWDAQTGRPMHSLFGHMDGVVALAFSPDGRVLASAGRDRRVWLWDVRSGRSLQALLSASPGLRALSFTPDGRGLLTGGQDGLTLWQMPGGRLLGQMQALGTGWLILSPVGPEGDSPRLVLYAAEPEAPPSLRMSDGLTSYPASGWARLCHRPHLVTQTLGGRPYPSLEEVREDLLAAPVPMPVLESSGSKATATALPQTLFFGGLGGGLGEPASSYVRLFTADELLSSEAQARGELVRGAVVPVSPAPYAPGRISGRLHAYLVMHVFGKNLGDLPSSDTGYLLQRNPDVVRAPDVSFVARERVPQGGTAGFFTGAPDLAAEVISSANEWVVVEQKAQEYLQTGARLVWVLDPQTRTVHVHESPVSVRILGEADQLTGGSVLPGFAVAVRELFGA